MDQPRWIPQLYGYMVCLIAVITILVSLTSLVNNLFEYSEPEMSHEISGEFGGRSLETCKQRYMMRAASAARPSEPSTVNAELPADSVLTKLCAEEREDRVVSVRHRALRSLVTSALMLIVAGVLFGAHWRWLRGSRVAMT